MDTRQLRYFRAIAEFGSFSRASVALRISQPALSRHVQGLEDYLGVPLLSRHSRGIRLTEAGRHLLERARIILRDFDGLREEVLAAGDTQVGHLTIALPPAVGVNLLPQLLQRFRMRYPRVKFEIWSAYSGHMRDWLNARVVDLALIHNPEPQPGIAAIPLLLEPLCLVGPATGPLKLSGKSLSLADLATRPLIMPRGFNRFRARFDHEATQLGFTPRIEIEVDGHSVLQTLVRNGIGYTVDTAGAALEGLRLKEFTVAPIRPRIEMALSMEYWKDQTLSPAMSYLMELIPAICRESIEKGKWPARLPGSASRR